MKETIKLLGMLLLAAVVSACSSDNDPMDGPDHHRNAMCRMQLRLTGCFVEDYDMPLTKALNNTESSLYVGINVSRRKGGSGSYERFAYGVFDNTDQIYINLYSGDQYKFEVTVIQNRTDLLQLLNGNFSYPFRRPNYQYNASDVNKFRTDPDYLAYLSSGTAYCVSPQDESDGKPAYAFQYPRMHRFYGTTEVTISSSGTQDVVIDMQYNCFGIQINTASLPEGSKLTWQEADYKDNYRDRYLRFDSSAKFESNAAKNSGGGYTWEDVYSLNSFSSPTKDSTIRFTLTRSDGTAVTFDKTVTFTRGKKKILNVVIDSSNEASGSHIVISGLDTTLSNEDSDEVKF